MLLTKPLTPPRGSSARLLSGAVPTQARLGSSPGAKGEPVRRLDQLLARAAQLYLNRILIHSRDRGQFLDGMALDFLEKQQAPVFFGNPRQQFHDVVPAR